MYHLCRSFLSPPSGITPSSPPPAIAMPPPNCFLRLHRDGKCAPRSGGIPCAARGAHLHYQRHPKRSPWSSSAQPARSPTPACPRRRVTLARATKGSSGRSSPAAAASRSRSGELSATFLPGAALRTSTAGIGVCSFYPQPPGVAYRPVELACVNGCALAGRARVAGNSTSV